MDKPIRKGNSSACAYSELISNLTKYFQSVDYNMVNVEAPFVTREMAEHQSFPDKGLTICAFIEVNLKHVPSGMAFFSYNTVW